MTKVYTIFNRHPELMTLERLHGTQVYRLVYRTDGARFELTFSYGELGHFMNDLTKHAENLHQEEQLP